MHVLFIHKNFPAQFGHIARALIANRDCRCTFVSETPGGNVDGIQKIQYKVQGGATAQTHYCSRTFENAVWQAAAVFDALAPHRQTLAPDLIVGHSGFGSTLFLPEIFPGVPILNYFEYYYHGHGSDLDFRPEWPVPEMNYLRSRTRNAMVLLDLENCQAGYTPTHFQKSLLPQAYHSKVQVLHDGIDTDLWFRQENPSRTVGSHSFGPETRIVTYVARGFESMRGFDLFMRAAKRIYERFPNVVFLVVGSNRVCYGGDLNHIQEKTFLEHVLRQDQYDLRKILFLGSLPPAELCRILSLSDLHIYLTVPFVLSWSLLNAMACRCTIVASNTAPVSEVLEHGKSALLCDFFDVDGIVSRSLEVLRRPAEYRPLGTAAAERVSQQFSLKVILPKMVQLYEDTIRIQPAQTHKVAGL